jgi:flagellar biosynthetic protein FlhB
MPAQDKHAKTEPATPKRKKEARDRGQVARSPDVSGWASVLVGTFLLPWMFGQAERRVLGVVGQGTNVMAHPTPQGAFAVLSGGLRSVVYVILPIAGIFAVLAIVANLAQVGRSFSFKAARPQLSRLSPKNGFKRLFGTQTLVQLGKQVVKLVLLVGVGYSSIHGLYAEVTGTSPVGLAPILGATASSIIGFVRIVALVSILVGIAEFAFQKRHLQTSLKMTKQEVKDESKAQEGDPAMKGELRKRMYVIARSKALAAVRSADVVVTNPTHFAVALQYRPGTGGAPRVVAKGADTLARHMRERAVEAEVPIVEDPPLARYLYAVCEVDQQIPAEIYTAVAKLLAFVYALPAMTRTAVVHHVAASVLPDVAKTLESLPVAARLRASAVLAGAAR